MAGPAAVQGLVRGICLQAGGVLAPEAAAVVQGLRVDRFAGGQGHGGLVGDDGANGQVPRTRGEQRSRAHSSQQQL